MRARTEFTAAVRGGVRAASSSLVVHLRPSVPGATHPQVGFIVTRSVGGAVARNTVRRRLRHLLRDRLDRLPAGARLVLRVTPAAAGRSSAQLAVDLDGALDRALHHTPGQAALQ
jgi:ribonuclease P protein component